MSMLSHRPRLSEEEAVEVAQELYGLGVHARQLDGERDQNFRLEGKDGHRWLLKIANPQEKLEILELQDKALTRLAESEINQIPRVVATLDGSRLGSTKLGEAESAVRLLTWLPGKPLAQVKPQSREVLSQLGHLLGRVNQALEGFDHPAAHRYLHWDLQHAPAVIEERLSDLGSDKRRRLVQRQVERFHVQAGPRLSGLRKAIIQADANDWNVLVASPSPGATEVSGLIDFGDMLCSWQAAEPAIAMAYVMLGKQRPLAAAASVLSGYHQRFPLNEDEIAVQWDLAVMRLCTSVVMAAAQRKADPDNEYLSITERAAWAFLEQVDEISPQLAHYQFREACGLVPCPKSVFVSRWIDEHPPAPVLGYALSDAKTCVIDLDVATSPYLSGGTSVANYSRQIARHIEDREARVGIGRYDEARACYVGDAFEQGGDGLEERRTVHLGIDLFVPAGSEVCAPYAGEVVGRQDNAQVGDYGPTVILRHRPEKAPEFFTLYGHLSRGSLNRLDLGQSIEGGAAFAEVGEESENGNWPPHLHFQLIVDPLNDEGDFPGVAAPSERELRLSISPNPAACLQLGAEAVAPRGRSKERLLAMRKEHLGRNLSVAYREPLKIVRGQGAYLFDEQGQAYLDCVNNVCHVGHAHPKVVEAATRQMEVLNTNTRYLHDKLADYSERLCALFPAPLSVCFLVCSGSEANELALRLARHYTKRQALLCLEAAYHGNTSQLLEISPYKHHGPGGAGTPPHVGVLPLPDAYRGRHRSGQGDLAARYAAYVEQALDGLATEGQEVAALIAESIPGCAGQVVLPDGYLELAYKQVRARGGLCIADEVQVGFGRVGSHWWGFETQGVVPDIVTLGKPIGNGHPIGAVITTPTIADAFDNGMEYFNTFGGNPVSCAVGTAVLDVIEQEDLRNKAEQLGSLLLRGLRELAERHPLLGDVRGMGLFIGVELVLDRVAKTPAPKHATWIAERMRQLGVLLSTDGPDHNVLKLKPPLAMSEADAQRLLAKLGAVLAESELQLD